MQVNKQKQAKDKPTTTSTKRSKQEPSHNPSTYGPHDHTLVGRPARSTISGAKKTKKQPRRRKDKTRSEALRLMPGPNLDFCGQFPSIIGSSVPTQTRELQERKGGTRKKTKERERESETGRTKDR